MTAIAGVRLRLSWSLPTNSDAAGETLNKGVEGTLGETMDGCLSSFLIRKRTGHAEYRVGIVVFVEL